MACDVLILGVPLDYHAEAVRWALGQLGVGTSIWVAGNLPDKDRLSVHFDCGGIRAHSANEGQTQDFLTARVVWNRRHHRPKAPDFSAEVDRPFIEDQCYEHVLGLRHLLESRADVINDPSAQAIADRKAIQLMTAKEVGFAVPDTLVSNDFDEITDFWDRNDPIIVKPFRGISWTAGADIYAAFTARMPRPEGEDRAALELCPQIFQAYVHDKRDVRVVAFGDHFFAAIMTPIGDADVVDVREALRNRAISYLAIDPPDQVKDKCTRYLQKLGLQFGAFDFALTPDDEWVFLECNQAGQFLFLEASLPDLPVLDAFARWIAGKAGQDSPSVTQRLTLGQFDASGRWEHANAHDPEQHKILYPDAFVEHA